MGHSIIKLADKYLIWSSVVDAPITYGMNLEEIKRYCVIEYDMSFLEIESKLKIVEEKGTSSYLFKNVDDQIALNHAGENGECLSKEEVIKAFCSGIPEDEDPSAPSES